MQASLLTACAACWSWTATLDLIGSFEKCRDEGKALRVLSEDPYSKKELSTKGGTGMDASIAALQV